MSSSLIVVIVIAVLVAVVAAIAGYYLVRHSRGSIKLTLPGGAYDSGGTIEGSFIMTTKKPLESKRLLVAVIGREVTEERDGNYFGPTLNLAARAMAVAHGGQCVLTDVVQAATGAQVTDLGEHHLRDIETPVHLYLLGTGTFPALLFAQLAKRLRPSGLMLGSIRMMLSCSNSLTNSDREEAR